MNLYPPFAVLKYPQNLPKQNIRVRTVYPDKVLNATMWALHHRVENKVCITLADRAELHKP